MARRLSDHPAVSWVSYTGLESDKYYNVAQRYLPKGAGAEVVRLSIGIETAADIIANLDQALW